MPVCDRRGAVGFAPERAGAASPSVPLSSRPQAIARGFRDRPRELADPYRRRGGETHDLVGSDHLLPRMEADTLIGDKAFDADARVLEPLAKAGKTAVIPPRTHRSSPRDYERELYVAPPSDRELLCQDQAVSCDRHPIRENRAQLPRRRPGRRKRRLA